MVLSLSAGLFEARAQDAGDGACDPEIRQGLVESATVGVQEDLAVIRDPDQGIRNPDSILDLSCLEELFDFGGFDVFYTPQDSWLDVLGLLQRRICAVANAAYDNYVGRRLDPSVMLGDLDRLPGVEVDRHQRPFLAPAPQGQELDVNLENYRNTLGGE